MRSSFYLGEWLVDSHRNRLVRGSEQVKLDPKAIQVLSFLAEHPNEIVTKEDLIATVWDGAFVSDEVLTTAVWGLRKALGDDAKEPRYIQTVPRKGYRLIARVDHAGAHASALPYRRLVPIAAVGIIAVCLIWLWPSPDAPDALEPMRSVPLTSLAGFESEPSVSPDGKQVAFLWDGSDDGHIHLYLELIGRPGLLQLTSALADDSSPSWSPDGREIAFLRASPEGHEVLAVSALGRGERRLATAWSGAEELAWSPDGRTLALVDVDSASLRHAIFLLDLDSVQRSRLTSPPEGTLGDARPRFSPDGKNVAFLRRGTGSQDLYVQPVDGGEAQRLTAENNLISDLAWTSDGSDVVFAYGAEDADWRLRRVPSKGGKASALPLGEHARSLSITPAGNLLVYQQLIEDMDLYRAPGPRGDRSIAPHRFAASSTRIEGHPQYSPDGSRVAFLSARSGRSSIWVCDEEGENCIRLTSENDFSLAPAWSPSSSRIAYHRWNQEKGVAEAHVVDARGGVPRRVTPEGEVGSYPSWSPDERALYVNTLRRGVFEISRVELDGGELTDVTKDGGWRPWPSADGRFVFSTRSEERGIWRVSLDDGRTERIVEKSVPATQWCLWNDALVYVAEHDDTASVEMLDLKSETTTELFSLGDRPRHTIPDLWQGLTVSPDGRWILYSRVSSSSDLVMIENFR
jgi:Tol biopolymer transport system component/DNA-binding winged helix-turn-helix (wHTH) protein